MSEGVKCMAVSSPTYQAIGAGWWRSVSTKFVPGLYSAVHVFSPCLWAASRNSFVRPAV